MVYHEISEELISNSFIKNVFCLRVLRDLCGESFFFNGSGSAFEDPHLFSADSDLAPVPSRDICVEELSR